MNNHSKLLLCIVLLFSQIIVTYFSFFSEQVFLYGLQPESLTKTSGATNNQSRSSFQITAGKIQDLSFKLDLSNPTSNTGLITLPETLSDIAISIVPQSSSVKIIGPTTWSIPRLDANSSQKISTKVYASPSIIGSPVFFTVDIQYIKNGQERKTNSFDIGAVVVGDINIEANNLAVRYVGDTPNLVGNLLNKGNTPALFTNLQALSVTPQIGEREQQVGNKMLQGASQFLGTLLVNTPTPFSIPISIDSNTSISGENQINQTSNTNQTNMTNKSTKSNGPNNSTTTITNNTSTAISANSTGNGNNTHINQTVFPTTYKIPLKISYSDELRNNHELILNNSIRFEFIGDESGNTKTSYRSNNGGLSTEQNGSLQLESVLNNGFVDAYWAEGIPSSNSNNDVNVNSENSSSGTTVTTTTTGTVQQQREVGPGEGQAILAVVLTNTAFSDITGITGYLTLPSGFSSPIPLSSSNTSSHTIYSQALSPNLVNSSTNIVTGNNKVNQNFPVIASINDVVKAGQTYTLYFKVNILKTADIGPHTALLRTYYFKTPDPEIGAYRLQTTAVPFVLPGKVILDVSSSSTDLIPGEVNHVKIQIRNKGTADANNVVATLGSVGGGIITSVGDSTANSNNSEISTNTTKNNNLTISPSAPYSKPAGNKEKEASSLGSRVFDLGTISANSGEEIDATILPSFSAGESLQNLNLQLTYTDATGEAKSSSEEVGFRVLPNPPEAGLAVNPNFPQNNLNITTENKETNQSSGINNDNNTTSSDSGLSVTPAGLTSDMITNNDSFNRIKLALLENQNNAKYNRLNDANYTKSNLTSIQSSILVSKANQSLYKNVAISNKPNGTENKNNIIQNSTSNRGDNSITITAGKESDLNFTITNNNRYPIIDAVVSLASQSGSISISGPSKWNLQTLNPGAHQFFPTTVFASKSMIGNPATFDVGVEYIMNGRARNDTFDIGTKVIGEIKVDVSDLAINYIAGTPNLVGNLLNKGNTVALFTTVQLLSTSNVTDQHYSQQNKGLSQEASNLKDVNSKSSVNKSLTRLSSDKSVKGLVSASNLPSYLGDLQDDSPLPFSIPLTLLNNSSPGRYPVSLKVTYNDDLRNSHEIILNSSVDLSRPKERSGGNENQDRGILGLLLGKQYSLKIGQFSLPIPLIIIIVIIGLVTLIILKRRSNVAKIYTSSRVSKEDNFFLDEKSNNNKDGGAESTHSSMENDTVKDSGDERNH